MKIRGRDRDRDPTLRRNPGLLLSNKPDLQGHQWLPEFVPHLICKQNYHQTSLSLQRYNYKSIKQIYFILYILINGSLKSNLLT